MALHTGLTPNEESFPKISFPDSLGLGPADVEFATRGFEFPFESDSLTVENNIVGAECRDFTTEPAGSQFVSIPMIFDDPTSTRYETIVGPSQGLFSDHQFVPARSLHLLPSPANRPEALFSSLQAPMIQPANTFDGGSGSAITFPGLDEYNSEFRCGADCDADAGIGLSAGEFYRSNHSQLQQGPSVVSYDGMVLGQGMNGMYSAGMLHDSNFGFAGFPSSQDLIPSYSHTASIDIVTKLRQGSSGSSSASPPSDVEKKPPPTEQIKYYDERPERPADKPWVRVNATTKGKTSRTGKINHYNPEKYYSKIPHPLNSAWTTDRGREFRYNQWHELVNDCMPSSVLRDFIYQHPKTKNCRLTLFIQRSPADSKRRYPTSTLDKCRFKECPMRIYGNRGSFLHGHYRVALDELAHRYGRGEHCDPFHVAGYVHLYCLERFLDLPAVCQLAHVRVEADGRQISKEPNGSFAPALGGNEYRIALNFIDVARSGRLRDQVEWASYPEHLEFRDSDGARCVEPKQHRYTLNHALQTCKNQGRGGRVMKRLKPSNVAVHRGDLEMYCLGRKNMLSEEQMAQILQELEDSDNAAAVRSSTIQGEKRQVVDFIDSSGPIGKKAKY